MPKHKNTQINKTVRKQRQSIGAVPPCAQTRPCHVSFCLQLRPEYWHGATVLIGTTVPLLIPATLKQPSFNPKHGKMSSSRIPERVDELEAQVKFLQTQIAQLMEEKKRWTRSPSHSRTHVYSDESEREERSYIVNSSDEETPRRRM